MNRIYVATAFAFCSLAVACSSGPSESESAGEVTADELSLAAADMPEAGKCKAKLEEIQKAGSRCLAEAGEQHARMVRRLDEMRKTCGKVDPPPEKPRAADPPPEKPSAADPPPEKPRAADPPPDFCRGLKGQFEQARLAHRDAAEACRETRRNALEKLASVCAPKKR